MTTLAIKDLATSKEMDHKAMADVSGGLFEIGRTTNDVDSFVFDMFAGIESNVYQSNDLAQGSAVNTTNSGHGPVIVNADNNALQANLNLLIPTIATAVGPTTL